MIRLYRCLRRINYTIFTAHPAMILEALFSGIITLLVIVFCLFISEALRCNPNISKYLLGTK